MNEEMDVEGGGHDMPVESYERSGTRALRRKVSPRRTA